jgi:hypothetical protein
MAMARKTRPTTIKIIIKKEPNHHGRFRNNLRNYSSSGFIRTLSTRAAHTLEETIMNTITAQSNETELQTIVREWINESAEDYDSGVEGVLKDLMYGGCQSGMVSELIYYSDTLEFYNKHQTEINEMLTSLMGDTGVSSPAELFGDKWANDDPLALDQTNQNLLAWFAFEETAQQLASEAGINL